ncbi:hypothetical protein ND748_03430 [Frankia sp. AiPs1]|uniref:glycine-rich domain-containing protein n=1 Tax=Frankia sp. AiPs1 TaxID=573493 RepID=UPI002044A607|nr:hypothetical protein [Frankia sp. AiPs1]MCM3920728.1 hypothetical protein [Frankia sp. AiPs1]
MTSARELVAPDLFNRLAERVMKDEGHDRDHSERIVDQALVFLKACADNPGAALGPSTAVDAGWHAFLLHTRDYASFCARVAGRFIHHEPTDGDSSRAGTLHRTITAVRATGYEVDESMWALAAVADCADEGNCSASGKDGDENKDTRIPK